MIAQSFTARPDQMVSPTSSDSAHVPISRPQALADVLLALALTVLGAVAAPLAGQTLVVRFGWPLLAVLMMQGVIILIGLYVLLARRGQRWRDIGFRRLRLRDVGFGVLALLLVFALNAAVSVVGLRLAPELIEFHQQRLADVARILTGDLPLVAVAAAMLFTGFYEEVLARGFLLTRCRRLLAGRWGPVLLSSALFGLGHFYQGWVGVVQTALVGVVFARLTLAYGTLWPAILAHAALNTISLGVLRALSNGS